jgi:hypothetical protein
MSTMSLPLTDPKLAAAAPLLGGRLSDILHDPRSGRVTFVFDGLPSDFMTRAFNGETVVNLRDYLDALERVHMLIAQYRARSGGRPAHSGRSAKASREP